jgi:hypothetical protein
MAKQETPLRLLVVGLSWPPETFLARLLHGLADRGVQVTLAGARRPRPATGWGERGAAGCRCRGAARRSPYGGRPLPDGAGT